MRHVFLYLILYLSILSFHVDPVFSQDVVKTNNPDGWLLKTEESVYQMILTGDKKIRHVYYGTPEQMDFLKSNTKWTNSIDELPVRGGLPFKIPVMEVIFADGVRDLDLTQVSHPFKKRI